MSRASWLVPVVVGVGVAVAGFMFLTPDVQLPSVAPRAAASAAAAAPDAAQPGKPKFVPTLGGPSQSPASAPGAGLPNAAGLTPEQTRQMIADIKNQVGDGSLNRNMPGFDGGVPANDPGRAVAQRASNLMNQAEASLEAARQRAGWDEKTWGSVSASLEHYDQKLADIQARASEKTTTTAGAVAEIDQAGKALIDEVRKTAGDATADEVAKSVGQDPANDAEDVDWFGGIPFEEWAAQMEREQAGKR